MWSIKIVASIEMWLASLPPYLPLGLYLGTTYHNRQFCTTLESLAVFTNQQVQVAIDIETTVHM